MENPLLKIQIEKEELILQESEEKGISNLLFNRPPEIRIAQMHSVYTI